MTALPERFRTLVAAALGRVRTAEPSVLWGNEPMNGGNLLFLWATAWARHQETGARWVVRYKPKMDPWLAEFPALAELTVAESEIGFRQHRTLGWGQDVGVDFQLSHLKEFCRTVLLSGSDFPDRWASVHRDAVVINVRRGDYYSVPEHRRRYGFDVPAYVAAALEEAGGVGRKPGDLSWLGDRPVVAVSDDPQWCRDHLSHLVPGPLETMPEPHDMFQDLAQISAAQVLILANSTFSYWGGYLASSRPVRERPQRVIAPVFFARETYHAAESPLLLPEWLGLPEDRYTEGAQP